MDSLLTICQSPYPTEAKPAVVLQILTTLPAFEDVRDGLESYRKTKARADELEEQIEKTDDLIDQLVYELYGLTDEEIEIVEEAVGE